jgi:hypothetical protein
MVENIGIPLWVDDCKPCPDNCASAKTYDDAVSMLRKYKYSMLYLDYDLNDKYWRTGADLLRQAIQENIVPPIVKCISLNPKGIKEINDILQLL